MELSLDSCSAFVPKTISDFIAEVSAIGKSADRLSKLDDYVGKLEEEGRKIEAFKRELPISVLLVNDAILRLKVEARAIVECLESRRDERAIEEFMPLKKKGKSFDEDEDEDEEEEEIGRVNSESDFSDDKRNWMSSAQLWSSNGEIDPKPRRVVVEEEEEGGQIHQPGEGQGCKYRNRGGAFVPFKASSGSSPQITTSLSLMPQVSELGCGSSSIATTNSNSQTSHGNNHNNNAGFRGVSGSSSGFFRDQVKLLPSKPQTHQQQTQQAFRKQRRCWSPELHRRFVDALQQLGGSQAATPKQIRELMQVEGLTNDEVKSHLQKYRLHVRKLPNSPATQGSAGLWTTQQDHSGDNSKANMNMSQSSSPQGPLLANGSNKALSNTGGDSTEAEEDDERSDGHSWRGHGGNHKEAREE